MAFKKFQNSNEIRRLINRQNLIQKRAVAMINRGTDKGNLYQKLNQRVGIKRQMSQATINVMMDIFRNEHITTIPENSFVVFARTTLNVHDGEPQELLLQLNKLDSYTLFLAPKQSSEKIFSTPKRGWLMTLRDDGWILMLPGQNPNQGIQLVLPEASEAEVTPTANTNQPARTSANAHVAKSAAPTESNASNHAAKIAESSTNQHSVKATSSSTAKRTPKAATSSTTKHVAKTTDSSHAKRSTKATTSSAAKHSTKVTDNSSSNSTKVTSNAIDSATKAAESSTAKYSIRNTTSSHATSNPISQTPSSHAPAKASQATATNSFTSNTTSQAHLTTSNAAVTSQVNHVATSAAATKPLPGPREADELIKNLVESGRRYRVVGLDYGKINMITATDGDDNTLQVPGSIISKHILDYQHEIRQMQRQTQTLDDDVELTRLSYMLKRYVLKSCRKIVNQLIAHYGDDVIYVTELHPSLDVNKTPNIILSPDYFYKALFTILFELVGHNSAIIQVPNNETSIICPVCGFTSSGNRQKELHTFKCLNCGFESNDDQAAATNIRQRGLRYISNLTKNMNFTVATPEVTHAPVQEEI